MAYTTPRTWTAGETVTAALMNTHLRDNIAYLKAEIESNDTDIAKIYAGMVESDGSAGRLPSGWSSTRNSTGLYTITHNLDTTGYAPIAIVEGVGGGYAACKLLNVGTNTFQVQTYNANTGALVSQRFYFHLIKY